MIPSLPALLHASAARHPERPAILHERGTVSYARLARDVEHLAGHLAELDLAGGRIGLLCPNLPVFPLALYGAWRAGCGVVLLNPLLSPREIAELLRDAQARTVITLESLRELLPAGTSVLLVDALPEVLRLDAGTGPRVLPLGDAAPPDGQPRGGNDEAAVLYTSANDGWARGAVLSHRNLIANLTSTIEAMRIVPADRVIAALPLIHAFGLTVSLNATLAAGACLLPVERFNPVRLLDLLERTGATMFAGVPSMFLSMIQVAERREPTAHSLRVAICGGAPLEARTAERWQALFNLPLRQGYGITEASPVCLFSHVDLPNLVATLGVPLPGVEVSVRDPHGRALPPGEVGELCVRGENVFRGYLNDPAPTATLFHGNWLRTGDLASEEPSGAIRYRGLLKPMFTRNGFNVYPRELKRVLEGDNRVAEATVLALPDPLRENEIVLQIRPRPGAELTEDEVKAFCKANLAAYKQPSRVVMVS